MKRLLRFESPYRDRSAEKTSSTRWPSAWILCKDHENQMSCLYRPCGQLRLLHHVMYSIFKWKELDVLSDASPPSDLCCSLELNHTMLIRLTRGKLTEPAFLQGFFWQYCRLDCTDTIGWELSCMTTSLNQQWTDCKFNWNDCLLLSSF